MIPENVTLTVKAPNQQIEDQNIECQSSWTVRELKSHLSEVYPSKPTPEEQKIIYSGQLLNDKIILKDILRTYESQSVYTVHLVCAPKRIMEPTPAETEGLRRRTVGSQESLPNERPAETASRPEVRQNDQNHTVEMQNYLSSFVSNYGRMPPYPNYNLGDGYLPVPNDPALLANHMMVMQQAYLQYMQQYANMWQGAGNVPPTLPTTPEAPPPADVPEAAAAPEEVEEAAPRDWLDHMYAGSRLAILFFLVYLYGSPARLVLVLLLAAAGYLHQIGFFRDLNVNQANVEHEPPPVAQPPPAPQPNQPEPVQPDVTPTVNQPVDNSNNPVDNSNNPSLLAVWWMVFSSFFASLIPDTN